MHGQNVRFTHRVLPLTLKVLVATIDAQWEGMGDVGSARYEPALLPPCPTIRVLSYSNKLIFRNSALAALSMRQVLTDIASINSP